MLFTRERDMNQSFFPSSMFCCQIPKDFSKSAAVNLRRGIPDFSETYFANIACFAFAVSKPEAEVCLEFRLDSSK